MHCKKQLMHGNIPHHHQKGNPGIANYVGLCSQDVQAWNIMIQSTEGVGIHNI